jgi:type I restriction enzyme S subunit
MGKWLNTKLSEVVELIHGYQFRDEDFVVSGIPVIKINNITNGSLKLSDFSYVNEKRLKEFNDIIIKNGDILMSLTGNIGRVVEVRDLSIPVFQNYRVGKFEPKDRRVKKPFLKHLLSQNTLFQQLARYANQSAQANFGKQDMDKLIVDYPEDEVEQTHIAEILSTADKAIAHTEALIAKYQQIKTGLMQDLLTQGIDEHGNIRSKATHGFEVKNGIEVPEEWEVDSLEKLTRSTITYGIVQAGPDTPDGIPYIRTGDMSGDHLSSKDLLRTTKSIASKFKRSTVEEGDIVFALRATIGKVLVVPKELQGANLTQGTARIAPNWNLVTTQFLLWTMRMFYFKSQILKLQKGTTFSEITLGELREMQIAYPKSLDEQHRIMRLIEEQENLIQEYKLNLSKLHLLKTGLTQDLLSGKVRVKAN